MFYTNSVVSSGMHLAKCFNIYTKTVDGIDNALWLATQTPKIHCYSTPSNTLGICAQNIVIVAGRNEFKLFFMLHYLTVVTMAD